MTHALKEDQTCIKDYSEKSSLLDARHSNLRYLRSVRLQNGGECRPFMGNLQNSEPASLASGSHGCPR